MTDWPASSSHVFYSTVEVRWFGSGSVPQGVADWFAGCGADPEHAPPRTDHYFRLPNTPGLGVKLREGYLETKVRHRTLGIVPLHPTVRGAVELWRKWRFALAEQTDEAQYGMRLGAPWVSVAKTRMLRRYTVPEGGHVTRVVPGAYPFRGCVLELTSITVSGSRWWSICFEAHGDEASLPGSLQRVAAHALATGTPPRLDEAASCGYPAWLGGIEWEVHL